MLKILWKRGDIAPEEQFLLLSIIFCYLILDFYVETRIRFSLRDKRLFEITKVEITKIGCISFETRIRFSLRDKRLFEITKIGCISFQMTLTDCNDLKRPKMINLLYNTVYTYHSVTKCKKIYSKLGLSFVVFVELWPAYSCPLCSKLFKTENVQWLECSVNFICHSNTCITTIS